MGTPFTGYVRPPDTVTDVAGPESVRAAIARAADAYGVPGDILSGVWLHESGGAADPYQEVGYNYAGYGGFFGLPTYLLGSLQDQADAAARILRDRRADRGSWAGAVQAYNGGGYSLEAADVADRMLGAASSGAAVTMPSSPAAASPAPSSPIAPVSLPNPLDAVKSVVTAPVRAAGNAVADRLITTLVVGLVVALALVLIVEVIA